MNRPALVLTGVDTFVVEQRPPAESTGDAVAIDVDLVGLCGTDLHIPGLVSRSSSDMNWSGERRRGNWQGGRSWSIRSSPAATARPAALASDTYAPTCA